MSDAIQRRSRVLIVEDEGVVAMDIKNCLECAGFEVTGMAASAEAALAEVEKSRPDVVLMDIRIQGELDGVAAADLLQRRFGVPTIYLTAHGDKDTVERIKRTHPLAFMLKPFKEPELLNVVEIALERARAERELREREQWFATALDSIGDAVISLDDNGIIRLANAAAEAVTGWPRDNAVGRPISEVIGLADAEPAGDGKSLARLHAGAPGSRESGEFPIRTRDGSTGWVSERIATVTAPDGRSIKMAVIQDVTARKQAERMLRQQAGLLEQLREAVFTWELGSTISYWNRGAELLYGLTRQEALGRDPHALLQTAHPAGMAGLEEILEREGQWSGELSRTAKSGQRITVESTMTLAAPGRKTVLETGRDITERKRAEETRQLLSSIVTSSGDAIMAVDPEGIVLTWNKAAEQIYGYSSDEMVGQSILLTVPPDRREESLRIVAGLKRGEGVEHFETERVRKDGRRILVAITISPIQDATGKVVAGSGVVRDITGQKQATKALALSEERYRSLAFVTSQIVWTTNPQGEVEEDIPLWRAFTGQTVEEVKGLGRFEALHPEDRERVADLWSRAARTRSFFHTEYRMRRHDGEYRDMAVHGVPVLEDSGVIREWVGTCADITERKQAEEEIRGLNQDLERRVAERTALWEASNKELESFAYSVSHDLRAPLRALDGFSRILLEEHGSGLSGEAQRYLNLVRKNAVQMGQLIDDLLSFSRLGRQPLKKERIDMRALVRQLLDELVREQPGRRIETVIGELPPCEADPALLRQVLINLFSNALKYTRSRPLARIEVGVAGDESAAPGGGPVYYVRDNGAGFDMQYADKLFGVFQRLHRAEEYEGTGVGLALVHRVITRHGGRVWAQAAVDQGATFYFTLAAAGGTEAAPQLLSRPTNA